MRRPSGRTAAAVTLAAAGICAAIAGAPSDPGVTSVAVAARDLEAGHTISATDLAMRETRGAPDDAVRNLTDPPGRTLRIGLLAGEPVVERKLATRGDEGVSALVPPGMVAATFVPASRIELRRGETVLISATLDSSRTETRGNPYRVVAERARVIAVDQGDQRRVTVALTAQERSYLAAAAAYGSLDAAVLDPSG